MLSIYTWFASRIHALRAHSERGAAAVEYGLLVALIAVAIIVAVGALGGGLRETFETVVEKLPFVADGSGSTD